MGAEFISFKGKNRNPQRWRMLWIDFEKLFRPASQVTVRYARQTNERSLGKVQIVRARNRTWPNEFQINPD
jgi:hypothetical protein